jgi:hypothetical protein
MRLLLHRYDLRERVTLGTLAADGVYVCHTLEDAVREPYDGSVKDGVPVATWKIPGETAIPAGDYRVGITYSQRFRREMPILLDVPGFTGVRIHAGNTHADTEGCILVGRRVVGETIVESRLAFAKLFDMLDSALDAGDDVWITIASTPPDRRTHAA